MAKKKTKASGERGRKAARPAKAWLGKRREDTIESAIQFSPVSVCAEKEKIPNPRWHSVPIIIADPRTHGVYCKATHKVVKR